MNENIARFCLVAGIVNMGQNKMGKAIANALKQDIELVDAFGIKGYSPDNNLQASIFDALKEEKPQHTFYCLFYPLGIYCGFGAENIHHAYNKAAKYWGAPKQVGNPYYDIPHSVINRQCRILVTSNLTDMSQHHKLISHTLMTKLIKAWREENN